MLVSGGSDLYIAGLTEDGRDFIAEKYYVCVTANNGRRWVHSVQFKGCEVVQNEDGYNSYLDCRESARTAMELLESRVKVHLKSGGKLDPNMWYEIDPAYGSECWQALDSEGYFKELELKEENLK